MPCIQDRLGRVENINGNQIDLYLSQTKILCIFLGLLTVSIRLVRRDIARYNSKDFSEYTPPQSGWILLYNDVFRLPQKGTPIWMNKLLVGIQLFSIVLSIICK